MTTKPFDSILKNAMDLKGEMGQERLAIRQRKALAEKFASLVIGLSQVQLSKIMPMYMDVLVAMKATSKNDDTPYLLACREILSEKNTSWMRGRGLMWVKMAQGEDGALCENRKKIIREVLYLIAGGYEDKDKVPVLRAIQQMEKLGVDILTPAGTSQDSHYDKWRAFIPTIISFASERYLSFHVGGKKNPSLGLSGEDITNMWLKVAGLWNPDSPVMLHGPVREMALAGGRLAHTQTLEFSDMSKLYFEFLETMESEAAGPAGVLIRDEEDQTKYQQIRVMARKSRLISIAQSAGSEVSEERSFSGPKKVKM